MLSRCSGCVALPLVLVEDAKSRGDDLGYASVEGRGSNECILSSSSMHLTANKGNIRRPSSYHKCSPGTHPTQPMRLPTPARSRRTYPRCTAKAAQVGERVQHSTLLDDHPIFTKHANCSLQPALPRPTEHAGDIRILSIFAPSALVDHHSLFPLSISWWGEPLSTYLFTRQSDLQGTARCPLP
jgi:hypothetical protein